MSKVLVIDDEPKIVSFVTRALTARHICISFINLQSTRNRAAGGCAWLKGADRVKF